MTESNIKFSFDKKVIGRATGEFLMDRLTDPNEKRDLPKQLTKLKKS